MSYGISGSNEFELPRLNQNCKLTGTSNSFEATFAIPSQGSNEFELPGKNQNCRVIGTSNSFEATFAILPHGSNEFELPGRGAEVLHFSWVYDLACDRGGGGYGGVGEIDL